MGVLRVQCFCERCESCLHLLAAKRQNDPSKQTRSMRRRREIAQSAEPDRGMQWWAEVGESEQQQQENGE